MRAPPEGGSAAGALSNSPDSSWECYPGGAVLLRHADAIAQTVTRLQATCVLTLDPFDEDTAELWKERYGFKPVAPPLEAGAADSDRLWVSLEGLSR